MVGVDLSCLNFCGSFGFLGNQTGYFFGIGNFQNLFWGLLMKLKSTAVRLVLFFNYGMKFILFGHFCMNIV